MRHLAALFTLSLLSNAKSAVADADVSTSARGKGLPTACDFFCPARAVCERCWRGRCDYDGQEQLCFGCAESSCFNDRVLQGASYRDAKQKSNTAAMAIAAVAAMDQLNMTVEGQKYPDLKQSKAEKTAAKNKSVVLIQGDRATRVTVSADIVDGNTLADAPRTNNAKRKVSLLNAVNPGVPQAGVDRRRVGHMPDAEPQFTALVDERVWVPVSTFGKPQRAPNGYAHGFAASRGTDLTHGAGGQEQSGSSDQGGSQTQQPAGSASPGGTQNQEESTQNSGHGQQQNIGPSSIALVTDANRATAIDLLRGSAAGSAQPQVRENNSTDFYDTEQGGNDESTGDNGQTGDGQKSSIAGGLMDVTSTQFGGGQQGGGGGQNGGGQFGGGQQGGGQFGGGRQGGGQFGGGQFGGGQQGGGQFGGGQQGGGQFGGGQQGGGQFGGGQQGGGQFGGGQQGGGQFGGGQQGGGGGRLGGDQNGESQNGGHQNTEGHFDDNQTSGGQNGDDSQFGGMQTSGGQIGGGQNGGSQTGGGQFGGGQNSGGQTNAGEFGGGQSGSGSQIDGGQTGGGQFGGNTAKEQSLSVSSPQNGGTEGSQLSGGEQQTGGSESQRSGQQQNGNSESSRGGGQEGEQANGLRLFGLFGGGRSRSGESGSNQSPSRSNRGNSDNGRKNEPDQETTTEAASSDSTSTTAVSSTASSEATASSSEAAEAAAADIEGADTYSPPSAPAQEAAVYPVAFASLADRNLRRSGGLVAGLLGRPTRPVV